MLRHFIIFVAVAISSNVYAGNPGQAISLDELNTYSIDDIKSYKAMLNISVPTITSVTTYKLRYYTTNLKGQVVVATAGIAVPNETPVSNRPILSYQHGTSTKRADAPSGVGANELLVNGAFFASNGYLVVAADYLGLGENRDFHPYLHSQTEATACADAILAARGLKLSLSKKLFLTGYSQGGHATMALQRYWQTRFGAKYPVTASAPMAGPYDLSGSVIATAKQPQKIARASVMYTGYLILSMNMVYGLYSNLSTVVKAPYDTQMPTLFDGNLANAEIAGRLPPTLPELLQPSFIAMMASGVNDPFLAAVRENDVYDWKPLAPVQFCQGDADLDVPPANTVKAMARMKALGATVTRAVIPTGLNHATAGMPCFKATAAFFETLR